MSKSSRLFKAAEEAVDEVFSDDSVSMSETLALLSDLRSNIDIKMEALKGDIKRIGRSAE